ncbi:MAG: HEAT repeat domain-containing protein [Spirochaetaceae bacterium]|nr:HEAT repeat domain-containing protein [Spirochaetaceae bacterium]
MKLHKLVLLIFFAFFSAILCFSQETTPTTEDNTISLRKERERILAFGLNNEVSGLIKEFIASKDLSYNDHLSKLFVTTKSDQIQRDIIELYTVIKSNNLINQVIDKIKDRDYETRSVIIAGIRYISEINAVKENHDIFMELLEDNQKDFRIEAIKVLAATGNKNYSKPLMDLYESDDEAQVKLQILLDIGKLEDPETAEFLKDIASDKYLERTYRQYAINSLGYLKDENSFDDLVAAYKEDDPFIRIYAISAISKYDKREANLLIHEAIRDENWRIRKQAITDAGNRKSNDFTQILIYRADNDPVEDIRNTSLTALAEIGGKEAFDFIRSKASDPKIGVKTRHHAFTLAVNKDTANSLEMIETIFAKESSASNKAFLESLTSELCRVEYSGLAPFFEKMLESSSVVIRIAGLRGIRLNKISSLKDKVKAIAEDQKQATAVKNNAIATLEVL